MKYEVLQTRRFSRAYKRLHNNQVAEVNAVIDEISSNPGMGTQKRGDLARLFVVKFRVNHQEFLLGYTKQDQLKLLYLEALGSHENFYRDLK